MTLSWLISTLVQSPVDVVLAACCPVESSIQRDHHAMGVVPMKTSFHRDHIRFTEQLRAPPGAHQLEEC